MRPDRQSLLLRAMILLWLATIASLLITYAADEVRVERMVPEIPPSAVSPFPFPETISGMFLDSVPALEGEDSPPQTFLDQTGKEWRIIQVPPNLIWGLGVLGWTDQNKKVIWVTTGQGLNETQETVLHELMHVCLGTKRSSSIEDVHRLIYELSPKMERILMNNQDLTKWLTRKEK